jgi:hypothetical protein
MSKRRDSLIGLGRDASAALPRLVASGKNMAQKKLRVN